MKTKEKEKIINSIFTVRQDQRAENYYVIKRNKLWRKALIELIQITENDSYLLPFSPHMMIAVQKKI
jgi:hypothetical protein